MRTIEIKAYQFDELSEKAKGRARNQCREGLEIDLSYIVEEFTQVMDMIGLDVRGVDYSVGFCQSDFAAFNAKYSYKPGAAGAIRAKYSDCAYSDYYVGIAERLERLQEAHNFKLEAQASNGRRGGLSTCTSATIGDRYADVTDEDIDTLSEIFRGISQDLYYHLRDEVEYQNSDGQVEEIIICNQYEFDAEGNWLTLR